MTKLEQIANNDILKYVVSNWSLVRIENISLKEPSESTRLNGTENIIDCRRETALRRLMLRNNPTSPPTIGART